MICRPSAGVMTLGGRLGLAGLLVAVALLAFGMPVAEAQAVVTASPAPAPPAPVPPDTRTQYPSFLVNSYIGLTLGYLDNPFSDRDLPSDINATVRLHHAAFGVALFGHMFGEYVGAEVAYVRPARWVSYNDLPDGSSHSVWVALGEFTMKARLPLTPQASLQADLGLGITSRRGFQLGDTPAIADAHFHSVIVGLGFVYKKNDAWDALVDLSYLPGSAAHVQPRELYLAAGVRYTMHPLPPERVAHANASGVIVRANTFRLGYASNGVGYSVNTAVSHTVPIFWGGNVQIGRGVTLKYDRNVFHTRRLFALDFGSNVAVWRSADQNQMIWTLSAYPRLRFTLIRTRLSDIYLSYSVAGPTFFSREIVDGLETGTSRFIFQDALGFGTILGVRRQFLVGIDITHYSNGNLSVRNPGVMVPATFELGYAF